MFYVRCCHHQHFTMPNILFSFFFSLYRFVCTRFRSTYKVSRDETTTKKKKLKHWLSSLKNGTNEIKQQRKWYFTASRLRMAFFIECNLVLESSVWFFFSLFWIHAISQFAHSVQNMLHIEHEPSARETHIEIRTIYVYLIKKQESHSRANAPCC